MRPIPTAFLFAAASSLLGPLGQAQEFLYTTSQPEQTLSGSGGTVLRFVRPNEIVHLPVQPCPSRAEKWAPRTMFHTQAGDEDNDGIWWEPGMLGQIDALMIPWASTTAPNQRTIYYSPSAALGTTVSGAPGLRPGDVGRIVRVGTADGQVQHFIREEQIKQALGLPVTAVIDVDAIASQPNFGVFFSLDTDIVCNLCSTGPTLVRDGDLLMIPGPDLSWTTFGTVGAVLPGRALVVHTEAQMDAMVTNARVTNRFGACQTQILDLEGLELAGTGTAGTVPGCGGPRPYPHFLFSGESLTGGAILSTMAGGMIHNTGCMPYGTNCTFGPTLGNQIGLRPPSATLGIPSFVNALCASRAIVFSSEAQVPQIPVFTPAAIDFASPGANTWVFLTFGPTAPGSVAPSLPFTWGNLCYPDYYAPPAFMGVIGTASGFGTYTSPPVPWPTKLIFQGITITPWSTIEASTPTTLEVF